MIRLLKLKLGSRLKHITVF